MPRMPASDLVRGILEQWPSYLAYVTSFLTIGAVWMAHSAATGALRAADGVLYRPNLLLLLVHRREHLLPGPGRRALLRDRAVADLSPPVPSATS
jgi:Endosomal/lysosomal potassium channel TMEM175